MVETLPNPAAPAQNETCGVLAIMPFRKLWNSMVFISLGDWLGHLATSAISQALTGDGTTFAKLADAYNGRKSDVAYKNNENDVNVTIECLDWQQNRSNDQIRTNVSTFKDASP